MCAEVTRRNRHMLAVYLFLYEVHSIFFSVYFRMIEESTCAQYSCMPLHLICLLKFTLYILFGTSFRKPRCVQSKKPLCEFRQRLMVCYLQGWNNDSTSKHPYAFLISSFKHLRWIISMHVCCEKILL